MPQSMVKQRNIQEENLHIFSIIIMEDFIFGRAHTHYLKKFLNTKFG